MSEQYLWDQTGEPDPEIVELEGTLATLRMAEHKLIFVNIAQPSGWQSLLTGWKRWALPVSVATSGLLAVVLWLTFRPNLQPGVWEARKATGSPQLAGKLFTNGRIDLGSWLSTNTTSSIHLRTTIGELDVQPGTELSLAESGPGRQRFVMHYGSIHARISAPPGLFVVDTPSARAIDLGCEYTLKVDHDGRGELSVSAGWVQLQHFWQQSLVPAGNLAKIAADGTVSPAFFADATPAFQDAVVKFTLEKSLDTETRRQTLETILREARKRDAFTLLNLFTRADADERVQVFDRLNEFVPAPPGITQETARNWHMNSIDAWWPVVEKALGISEIKKGSKKLGE
ncbi:MAG TPA: hypothetical protein VHA33_01355 [Candidatus Angelobacter sp.]|jgi:hypothetical protein|nr:hypothetical protein [Candidatus Angelobacter sp.]